MRSYQTELNDYESLQRSLITGTPTRAVVVSNKDPLASGRVKVWIPVIHGAFRNSEDLDTEEGSDLPTLPASVKYPGNWQDETTQELLPWARCIGQNWGPRRNTNNVHVVTSGVFSIPKPGTEVYVIFENNDPNLPIVIGAFFHANEFEFEKRRPLELFPGTQVSDSSSNIGKVTVDADGATTLAQADAADYEARAAFSYSIRGENDSMLYICDYPGESAIMLAGSIKLTDKDTLINDKAAKMKRAYQSNYGFPTTASAAFAKRVLLDKDAAALAVPTLSALNATPFDSKATATDEVKTTPKPPEEVKAAEPQPAPVTSSVKQWPVKPPAGRPAPTFPGGWPRGNFGAPRPGYKNNEKKHVGVDIVAARDNSTILVAPIDMKLMGSKPSGSAGLQLFGLAPDGTGHGFFHLYAILPSISRLMKEAPGSIVKAGTPLGYCGNTGSASQGHHLHWEIFRDGNATSFSEFLNKRQSAVIAGTKAFHNPVDWMGLPVGPNTMIQGTPEQFRSWQDHVTSYDDRASSVEYVKPIGLEISTVPGQETVFLRHPSGAMLGFDADGNYMMFTPGDANHRVNRSWNLDVLGGILESCYAKFTRVKTVVRTWAKIFSNMRDKRQADNTYPDFFQRVEKHRHLDMLVSLRSVLGNAFYVNKGDAPIPLEHAYSSACPGVCTPPDTTERDFKNTTYDNMIKSAYSTHLTGDMLRVFPDWKFFKAQMLRESNGVADARSKGGSYIGLFQIGQIAIKDVTKSSLSESDFRAYQAPDKNIDMAMRVHAKNYYYVKSAIQNYVSKTQGATKFEEIPAEHIRNIIMFAYNVGPTEVKKRMDGLVEQLITYGAIEASYKAVHINNPDIKVHLQYVPSIIWIQQKL